MKNHRFLWLRNRTTNNRKCEKSRNIKEKRTIEMFSTVSKQLVALRSSASADLFQMYLYGSASAEPFFVACFPGELGSTTAHLRRLPRKGRAGGAKNLCSSIACRAQPCQRCTPVLQALICFRCIFTALLRQSRFCLLRSCAQKEHPRAFGPGAFCCDRECQVEEESIFCSWVLAR